MAELQVFAHAKGPTRFDLDVPCAVIGRESQCEIVIDDPLASRRHAQVLRNPDGQFMVEDLGSKNGILVNGKKLARAALRDGDVVRIGRTEILFTTGEPAILERAAVAGLEKTASAAELSFDARPTKYTGEQNTWQDSPLASTVAAPPVPARAAPPPSTGRTDRVRYLENENNVLRQALKRRGAPIGGDEQKTATLASAPSDAPLDWVLNPGLKISCPTVPGEPVPISASRGRGARGPAWAFLGAGRFGDRTGAELLELGHGRFIAAVEGLVPAARIAAPAAHVLRIAEGGVSQHIGRDLAPLAGALGVLRGDGERPTTDLFCLAETETFDEGAGTIEQVSDLRASLGLNDRALPQPRFHALLFGSKLGVPGSLPPALAGWTSLARTGQIGAVILVDRDSGALCGGVPDEARLCATIAGGLDTFSRLARFAPHAGRWGPRDLEHALCAAGFAALGFARTESCEEEALDRLFAAALGEGLSARAVPIAWARAVNVLVVVDRRILDARIATAAQLLTRAQTTAQLASPQAQIATAVFEAGDSGVRVFTWVSGIVA
jgi:hypothetical protein